jgi:hypothetical protein
VRVTDDDSVRALQDPSERDNDSRIEIMLPNGLCVRIVGAVDHRALTDVMSVLTPDFARNKEICDTESGRVSPRKASSC